MRIPSCVRKNRWRASPRRHQLARIGRVVHDDTIAFITALPATARLTVQGIRFLIAHGTPWSDILHVYPDSRPALYAQFYDRYGGDTDILVLGHTHRPMWMQVQTLTVLNPGSVYGVTGRDSATCATLLLPSQEYHLFSVKDGTRRMLPHIQV